MHLTLQRGLDNSGGQLKMVVVMVLGKKRVFCSLLTVCTVIHKKTTKLRCYLVVESTCTQTVSSTYVSPTLPKMTFNNP